MILRAARALLFVAQRDDGVLDGDEVAVAEIAGGAVVRLPEVVVRIELDEARSPLAQQLHRQEAHLALQLLFDLRDHARARRGVLRIGGAFPGAGR